jgi:hypothetical protein
MPTLALQPLPRHVRDLLQLVLKICTNSLEGNVVLAIRDLEQQLMRQVDQTMDNAERQRIRQALVSVEGSRSVLVANFLAALEAELALLQSPVVVRGQMTTRFRNADEMTLVNDQEIEETSALTDAATKAELQNSLPLFLLGQRFGVLAGRPAFDAETLPVGPQALCRSIRRAVERINLDVSGAPAAVPRLRAPGDARLQLARGAAQQRPGAQWRVAQPAVRARARAPHRPERRRGAHQRHRQQRPEAGRGPGCSRRDRGNGHQRRAAAAQGWPRAQDRGRGTRRTIAPGRAAAAGDGCHAGRRAGQRRRLCRAAQPALGPAPAAGQAQLGAFARRARGDAARGQRQRPAGSAARHAGAPGRAGDEPRRATARNIGHLKQDMLALLRRVSPDQEAPALSEEHNDAFDLVGMLYDNLSRDVKPGSTVANLLTKLQVPMVRVALQDQTFFTRQDHPARQMLNVIAETGTNWLNEDESDAALVGQLNSIVDRAVSEYRGDPGVFHTVLNELMGHLQTCRARRKSPSAGTWRRRRARRS